MTDAPLSGRRWPPVATVVAVHVGIAAILVGLAAFVFQGAVDFSSRKVSAAFSDLIPQGRKAVCAKPESSTGQVQAATVVEMAKSILPNVADYPASGAEKERIAVQALKAQRLQCLHMALFDMYARNYYGAIVTSMVFGGIAAIALFLVGPKGWSASSPYLVNVLLTSAAITAFYGAFPGVFQQASSATAHKAQILRYETLLDGMASHTAAPKLVPAICMNKSTAASGSRSDTPFSPADFIACTDAALANADIVFEFDPKSQPDYEKILGRAAGN
jgi:hypothetical protein